MSIWMIPVLWLRTHIQAVHADKPGKNIDRTFQSVGEYCNGAGEPPGQDFDQKKHDTNCSDDFLEAKIMLYGLQLNYFEGANIVSIIR